MRAALGLVLAALLFSGGAAAAQPVSLVADQVRMEGNDILVAEGNVEVFYEDARLQATRITYDRATGGLDIVGPIRLSQGAGGDFVLIGDGAELEDGLRNGIVQSARIVLNQQLQIAADQMAAIDGRYRQLTNAVASSCRVCREGQTPLWEIRAARVLHDTEERQIYFSRAQFRVAGVPVFYLPRLRLPDPSVERVRGFLAPELRGTSDLGRGLVVPYFFPLGRSADITVAPWITPETRTLEWRYRQEFRFGSVVFDGAFSRDSIEPGQLRGYALGSGTFRLPWDFGLAFRIEGASDDDYADQYDYNSGSRLQSYALVARVREHEFVDIELYNYDIVRPGALTAVDRNLTNVASADYARVLATRFGRVTFGLDADGYYRDSDEDVLGRDVGRLGAAASWWHGAVLPLGIAVEGEAELRADTYSIRRDRSYDPDVLLLMPTAAITLRWPLVRNGGGVAEMFEPAAQLVWSDVHGDDVPDEDSRVVEFDEGNLFALNRYPGSDRRETGMRLNVGANYMRRSGDWELSGYVGRIFRLDDRRQFDDPTGLNGAWSDWLVSAQVEVSDFITLSNRAVFDDDFEFARNELRLALEAGPADFATSYLWLEANPEVALPEDLSLAILSADVELNERWLGGVETRWDFVADRVTRTDLDLTYRNECVAVDLFVKREYMNSTSLEPDYSFGVEVSLNGFGSSDTRRFTRSCSG